VASAAFDPRAEPRSSGQAISTPPPLASNEPHKSWKPGLRTALMGLVLLTVAATAVVIHLTWFYAARRNVADVVGQLNRQIVGSVQHGVRGTLNDAWQGVRYFV
jgi:hypothetical protein